MVIVYYSWNFSGITDGGTRDSSANKVAKTTCKILSKFVESLNKSLFEVWCFGGYQENLLCREFNISGFSGGRTSQVFSQPLCYTSRRVSQTVLILERGFGPTNKKYLRWFFLGLGEET